MKLHVPVKLLRCILCLHAAALAFPAVYAQDSSPVPDRIVDTEGAGITISKDKDTDVSFTIPETTITDVSHFYGGAIYSPKSGTTPNDFAVNISSNRDVSFSGSVSSSGSCLTISHGNGYGGAISAGKDSYEDLGDEQTLGHNVTLSDNENVSFNTNIIDALYRARGGGIYADGHVTISNNNNIDFTSNKVNSQKNGSAVGGAISTYFLRESFDSTDGVSISLTGNRGRILFEGNSALAETWTSHGGAIYSGGALNITGNQEKITFKGNFSRNMSASDSSGGAIAVIGKASITGNVGAIRFENNHAAAPGGNVGGGAICVQNNKEGLDISNNSSDISFDNNSVGGMTHDQGQNYDKVIVGGAIASFSSVAINANGGNIDFTNNRVTSSGTYDLSFGGGNTSSENLGLGDLTAGGAITSMSDISISDNKGRVTFGGNTVTSEARNPDYTDIVYGGAIYSNPRNSIIQLNRNNGGVEFTNNEASGRGAFGGAIYGDKVQLTGNGLTSGTSDIISNIIYFSSNEASGRGAYGGAIHAEDNVTITDNNGNIYFGVNKLFAQGGNVSGGAVYTDLHEINISNNTGNVTFVGNEVHGIGTLTNADGSSSKLGVTVTGGAMTSYDYVSIQNNTGAVSLLNNQVIDKNTTETPLENNLFQVAEQYQITGGGAVAAANDVYLSHNGSVSIEGNTASSEGRDALGGAIGSFGTTHLSHNKGDVTVSNNASISDSRNALGGAIYSNGVSIMNNGGNVSFMGNYEQQGDDFRLRSLYVESSTFELAAADDKSITFQDSIRVGQGEDVKLNSYTDATGATKTTGGTIKFDGSTAESDLNSIIKGRTATDTEIENSRTSTIDRNVFVAGGKLQLTGEAKLKVGSSSDSAYQVNVLLGAELSIDSASSVSADEVMFQTGSIFSVQALTTTTISQEQGPAAMLDARNVTLTGGMTYKQTGAYTALGDSSTLTFVSNGENFVFEVDNTTAVTQGDTLYYILFTDVSELAGTPLSDIQYLLVGSQIDGTSSLGFDEASGTLYISGNAPTGGQTGAVPEPTTATLSLLALAALAARRRRTK